jgi:hypothetical protein
MTLLPTGMRSHRSRLAEQLRRAVRPTATRAALAAQVGRHGLDRARSRPLSSAAALGLIGLAAAVAASPRGREAVRRSLARVSGTLHRT